MNTFLRKLITPVAVFAASLGVALAMTGQREVVGAEAAEEAVYHSTSFNTTEGFTTSSTYNAARTDQGTSPYLWDFLNGTVSTTNAITSPSAHLRGYTDAQTPSLETAFAIPDITKVVFSYKSDTNISVNLSYSTDNRVTWSTVTNFARVISATQVTYTINAAGLAGSANLRWQMLNVGTATGSSAELIIDDITIYYMSSTPVVTLSSISISGTPETSYFEGESFDSTGITVTALYSDNSTADVTSLTTYTPEPLTAGITTVVAHYTELGVEKTADITGITVTAVVVTGISLKTAGTQLFTLGQTFNTSNLVITATKNNSTVEDVSAGLTVTGVNTMVLGQQTATVEYEGFTTTYQVNVTNNGASVGEPFFATDLFISEYIEGSSNNKAVEIFNGTGTDIDLSSYKINTYSAAGTTATYTLSLSGTLASGDVYVVSNSSANSTIAAVSDITSTITYYNGNDSVALLKNDVIIDIIGDQLGDPGTAWTGSDINSSPASTVEMTLVRDSSNLSPTTTFSFNQWIAYPQDTFSYLGTHDFASPDVTALEQATAYANYVWSGRGDFEQGTCVEVLADLEAEYGYMSTDAKNLFDGSTDELFINAQYRLSYLRAWVAANSPGGTANPLDLASNTSITLLIGILGLTSVVGFYLVSKKKYEN
ncbi:MAG: lamin tail domain-containing protein [Bacilli bacterium]